MQIKIYLHRDTLLLLRGSRKSAEIEKLLLEKAREALRKEVLWWPLYRANLSPEERQRVQARTAARYT